MMQYLQKYFQNLRKLVFGISFVLIFSFSLVHLAQASSITSKFFDSVKSLFFSDSESTNARIINLDENLLKPKISSFSIIDSKNSKNSKKPQDLKNKIHNSVSSDEYRDFDNLDLNKNTFFNVVSGPMRISTEEEKNLNDIISVYEVKGGDSLDSIAKIFDISKNTIVYANDLKNKIIKPGDILLIFPITGIQYTAKQSESINSIAKKYKVDATDVAEYNGLATDTKLAKGDVIFIPDIENEISDIFTPKRRPRYSSNFLAGYFLKPVNGCRKTQGLHGYNGIDMACKLGTALLASAQGKVLVAKSSGYNGGYGKMIIISHPNGTQTLYSHLSRVDVNMGENILQGQIIGATGNTGRSTGPHLHFEIRGAANPF